MKYGSITLEQLEAIINKLGGQELLNELLKDEKIVTVKDAIEPCFDEHGRRIPKDLQANVYKANWNFRLVQPKLTKADFVNGINRIKQHYESQFIGSEFEVTYEQLYLESERLLKIVRENPQIANIAKGTCLPVAIPKLVTDDNIGDELFICTYGVESSYENYFSRRIFYRNYEESLSKHTSIVEGSRHDQLIERMRQGPVIGLHFPSSLHGFSILAAREQMSTLPEGFILSGIDIPIAMMMYPDVFVRGYFTPDLNFAAFQFLENDGSSCFRIYEYNKKYYFEPTYDVVSAYDHISSGLLFIG